MKNIKISCPWELEFDLEHEKQIELYVDQIPRDAVPENTMRFVFLLEPPEIMDISPQALQGIRAGTYNHLFTHNQALLDATEKSSVFPLASTWIRGYEFPEKSFSVSTLVGGKRMAEGHLLRQKVWFKEDRITTPKRFFLSGNHNSGVENYNNNPVLGDDKKPLFDSQFHICIENINRRNWFTEKLIDCLITKTVPIYCGCENVGDWFDTRGFIIANDLEEIVDACNKLTEETYNEMLPYIEENYKRSLEYADVAVRLKDEILKLI